MITVTSSGSTGKVDGSLKKMQQINILAILNKYGNEGVSILSRATPIDTGRASISWEYEVQIKRSTYTVIWSNTDVESGAPVIILLQYGHGTRNGGWVEGRDFINPAMQPLFDKMSAEFWEEVKNA